MAGGTLDIGVVLQGFGVANEQLGLLQRSLKDLGSSHDFAKKQILRFGKASVEAEDALGTAKEATFDFATTLTSNLSVALKQTTDALREAGIRAENFRRQIRAVSREGEDAGKSLGKLFEISKLPGLELEQTAKAVTALRATKMSAQDAHETVIQFGNALATVGAGTYELEGTVTALSQIMSKGKVYAEEIYQIAERLPQTRVIMEDAFGTADTEVLAKEGLRSIDFIKAMNRGLSNLKRVTPGTQEAMKNLDNEFTKLRMNLSGTQSIFNWYTSTLAKFLGAINSLPKPILVVVGALTKLAGLLAQMGALYLAFVGVIKAVSLIRMAEIGIFNALNPLQNLRNAGIWGELYATEALIKSKKALSATMTLLSPHWKAILLAIGAITAVVGLGVLAWKKWGKSSVTSKDRIKDFEEKAKDAQSTLKLLNEEKNAFSNIVKFKNLILEEVNALRMLNDELKEQNKLTKEGFDIRDQHDVAVRVKGDAVIDPTGQMSSKQITDLALENLEGIPEEGLDNKIKAQKEKIEKHIDSFFGSIESKFTFQTSDTWETLKKDLKKNIDEGNTEGTRSDLVVIIEDAYRDTAKYLQAEIEQLKDFEKNQLKNRTNLEKNVEGVVVNLPLGSLENTAWAEDLNTRLRNAFDDEVSRAESVASDGTKRTLDVQKTIFGAYQSIGNVSISQINAVVSAMQASTRLGSKIIEEGKTITTELTDEQNKEVNALIIRAKEWGERYESKDKVKSIDAITGALAENTQNIEALNNVGNEIRVMIEGFTRYSQIVENLKSNLDLQAEDLSSFSDEQLEKLKQTRTDSGKIDWSSDTEYQTEKAKLESHNDLRLMAIQSTTTGLDNLLEFIELKRTDVLAYMFDSANDQKAFFTRFFSDKDDKEVETAWGQIAELTEQGQKALRYGVAQQYVQTIAQRHGALDADLKTAMDTTLERMFKSAGIIGKEGTLDLPKILEKYGLLDDGKLTWGDREQDPFYEAKGDEAQRMVLSWVKAIKTMGLTDNIGELSYDQLIGSVDYMSERISQEIKNASLEMEALERQLESETEVSRLSGMLKANQERISKLSIGFQTSGDEITQSIIEIANKKIELKIALQTDDTIDKANRVLEEKQLKEGTHSLQLKLSHLIVQQKLQDDESKIKQKIANRDIRITALERNTADSTVSARQVIITKLKGLNDLDNAELNIRQTTAKLNEARNQFLSNEHDEGVDKEKHMKAMYSSYVKEWENLEQAKAVRDNILKANSHNLIMAKLEESHEISLAEIEERLLFAKQKKEAFTQRKSEEEWKSATEREKVQDLMYSREVDYLEKQKNLEGLIFQQSQKTQSITQKQIDDAKIAVDIAKDLRDSYSTEFEFWEQTGMVQDSIRVAQEKIAQKHQIEGMLYQGGMSQRQIKQRGIFQQRELQESRRTTLERTSGGGRFKEIAEAMDSVGTESTMFGQPFRITYEYLEKIMGISKPAMDEVGKIRDELDSINDVIGEDILTPATREKISNALKAYQGFLDKDQHEEAKEQWEVIGTLIEKNGGKLGLQEILMNNLIDQERARNKTIKERERLLERENKSLDIQTSLLESLSIDPSKASGINIDGILRGMGLDEGIFNRFKGMSKSEREFLVETEKMSDERAKLLNEKISIENGLGWKEIKDATERDETRKQLLIDWNFDFVQLQTKHIADIINQNAKRKQAILDGYGDFKKNMSDMQDLRDQYTLAQFDVDNARTGDTKRTQRQRKELELQQQANKIMRESTSAVEDYLLTTTGKEGRFDLEGIIESGDADALNQYQNAFKSVFKTISETKKLEATMAKDRISKRTDLTKTQAQHNGQMEQMERSHMDTMANIRIDGDAKIQDIIHGQSADNEARIRARNEAQIEDAEKLERDKYNVQVQQEESRHAQSMRSKKEERQPGYGVDTDWYSNLMGSDIGKEANEMFKALNENLGGEFNARNREGVEEMLMGGGFMDAQGDINFEKIAGQITGNNEDLQKKWDTVVKDAKTKSGKGLPPLVQNTSAIKENTSILKQLIDFWKGLGSSNGNQESVDVANITANVKKQIASNSALQNPLGDESKVMNKSGWTMRETAPVVTPEFYIDGHEVTTGVARSRRDGLVGKHWDATGNEGQTARIRGDGAVNANVQGARGERQAGFEHLLTRQAKDKAKGKGKEAWKDFLNQPIANRPGNFGGDRNKQRR